MNKNKAHIIIIISALIIIAGRLSFGHEIHESARKGNLIKIHELIEKDPALLNLQDQTGSTPLQIASGHGYADIVEYLIKKGALVNTKNDKGWTPLFSAIAGEHISVVRLLIENNADVNIESRFRITPLYFAAVHGRREAVELLIKGGAKVNTRDNRIGFTPLHTAAYTGDTDFASLLIKNSADVNSRDFNNNTPLHLAAIEGYQDMVELLIKNGAKVNNSNNQGKTPLGAALEYGNDEAAAVIIRNGGSEKPDMEQPLPTPSPEKSPDTPLYKIIPPEVAGVKLTGILKGEKGYKAILSAIGNGRNNYMLEQGQKFGDWIVSDITQDTVILKTKGYMVILKLRSPE